MDSRINDLSIYRMEKACEDLDTSEILFSNKKYSQSINRSYYAMFHAVRALLAFDQFDTKKHSGIISYFNKNYVKTGIIEVEYSKMLTIAFKIRNDSDYKDFYIITHQDALLQLESAKKFIPRISDFIKTLDN